MLGFCERNCVDSTWTPSACAPLVQVMPPKGAPEEEGHPTPADLLARHLGTVTADEDESEPWDWYLAMVASGAPPNSERWAAFGPSFAAAYPSVEGGERAADLDCLGIERSPRRTATNTWKRVALSSF